MFRDQKLMLLLKLCLPKEFGVRLSDFLSAERVVEKERMELSRNKEGNKSGMDESLSDEAASIHDIDLSGMTQGDSMCSGEADSQEFSQDDPSLYTLEEINAFLDDTFGKQVNVIDFFPDIEKFEKSVSIHQKNRMLWPLLLLLLLLSQVLLGRLGINPLWLRLLQVWSLYLIL
ncbi:unnamed protein product [Leuciscus chuanchicus]